jgi:hypothetical protein
MTLAQPTSPAARRRHWEMLVICSIAIVLTFALTIRSDGRVAVRGIERIALPQTCLSRTLFGVDCPACGLTRSFIELSRGHWSESLAYHRLGWMMALAVVLQIPYRTACLATARSLHPMATTIFGQMLIAALLIRWVVTLRT